MSKTFQKVAISKLVLILTANDNRYEGQWKDGKKHGKGKFFYLDRGQLYTGVWCDDIPKCGTVEDFGRHEAPNPTTYPLHEVSVTHIIITQMCTC